MENNLLMRLEDLVNNPTPRIPICLCLDTSGSMGAVEGGEGKPTGETIFEDGRTWNLVRGGKSRIQKLQEGIELFYEAIRQDETALYAAEICVVEFNTQAKCVLDFANVDRHEEIPRLIATGETSLGEGVNLALELLEKRKQEYKDRGVDYFQPWLVIMTDGEANGSQAALNQAVNSTVNLINDKKLTVFPIGIGPEAGMTTLARFSPARSPLRLQGLKFKEFFEWLSQSVSTTSQSMPGEAIPLDAAGIRGWGEL